MNVLHSIMPSILRSPIAFKIGLALLLLVNMVVSPLAQADFPFGFGGSGNEKVVDIEVGPDGEVVVLGLFSDVLSFEDENGATIDWVRAVGESDLFVARFQSDGQLDWVAQSESDVSIIPQALTIDKNGSIFVTGGVSSTSRFGTAKITWPPDTDPRQFTARLDSENGKWTKTFGELSPLLGTNTGIGIISDADGDRLYTATGYPDGIAGSAVAGAIWSYDPDIAISGELLLLRFGTAFDNLVVGNNLIYVSGVNYSPTVEGAGFCGPMPFVGPFVAKLREEISFEETSPDSGVFVNTFSLDCDWVKPVEFDISPGKAALTTDGSNAYWYHNGLLRALNSQGDIFIDDVVSDPSAIYSPAGSSIRIDEENNIVVAGTYRGTTTFGQDATPEPDSMRRVLPETAVYSPYVARRNAAGSWTWAVAPDMSANVEGLSSADTNAHIALTSVGDVYLAGTFRGQMLLDVPPKDPILIESSDLSIDGALKFDGLNDFLSVPGAILDQAQNVTISFDVEVPLSAPFLGGTLLSAISTIGPTGGADEFSIAFTPNSRTLEVSGPDGVEVTFYMATETTPVSNKTYQLFRSVDGSVINYVLTEYPFLVGQLIPNPGGGSTFINQPTTKVYRKSYTCSEPVADCLRLDVDENGLIIGRKQSGGPGSFGSAPAFNGKISRLVISGTPASPAEEQAGIWEFDEATIGTTLLDSSNNGNHIPYVPDGSLRLPQKLGTTNAPTDGFISVLGRKSGEWVTAQLWTLGEEIPRPEGIEAANPDKIIDCVAQAEIGDYLFWSEADKKLYATGIPDCPITIRWKEDPEDTLSFRRLDRKGLVVLPPENEIQNHISAVPVWLEPAKNPEFNPLDNGEPLDTDEHLRFLRVVWPVAARNSALNDPAHGWQYRHQLAEGDSIEYAVLQYYKTDNPDRAADLANDVPYFMVVRTLPWNDARIRGADTDHDVGDPITAPDERYQDPLRNGYVINALSPYDGVGDARAHDRESRLGPIVPVNRPQDEDMVVAWYAQNPNETYWPNLAIRYDLAWPSDAEPIVVSTLKGSGPVPADAETFSSPRIYNQPDLALPGFNPNEEHALFRSKGDKIVVYALRDDLNDIDNNDEVEYSEPYVLLKYKNEDLDWAYEVFKVCANSQSDLCKDDAGIEDANFAPTYEADATDEEKLTDPFVNVVGSILSPPVPLDLLGSCSQSGVKQPGGDPAQAGWSDHQGTLWARAAHGFTQNLHDAPQTRDQTLVQYYYPLQPGFFFGFEGEEYDDKMVGDCVPWLPVDGTPSGDPVDVAYEFIWPDEVPVLNLGETLISPKRELPAINGKKAVQIVFDQATFDSIGGGDYTVDTPSLVRLIDPVSERRVDLAELPDDLSTSRRDGRTLFPDLPFTLRSRLSYDDENGWLLFGGDIDEKQLGDPHLLPNIMTASERDVIKALDGTDAAFDGAIDDLYDKTRNPNDVDVDSTDGPDQKYWVGYKGYTTVETVEQTNDDGSVSGEVEVETITLSPETLLGGDMMLSAGKAAGEGYVTLAFNNDASLGGLPVSLKVIKVSGCEIYQGNIWTVPSDNIFEESLTLRHTGDFGGDPDQFEYQWFFQPDANGQPDSPAGPDDPFSPWILHEQGLGLVDVTISGPGVKTLSDNWFVARYKGFENRQCASFEATAPEESAPEYAAWEEDYNAWLDEYSTWAGDPAWPVTEPKAWLATGWIKRVIAGLNPFDSRTSDFHSEAVNTISSLIAQIGEPYAGDIPFNPDGDVINSIGLVEAYETILRRGMDISTNAGINAVAANVQLLNVSTRIGDFYMMLGNEAFADAADPTIGFDTGSDLGSLASSIFAFQNQLDSPLEEELALLRGKDDSRGGVAAHPLFNRLPWNFTQGDGEVAYVQTYGIKDQPPYDGFISEVDAAKQRFPMGHGDAWGHYLTAVKTRYRLLREENFTWKPRTESVTLAGAVIEVDYLDERKFANAAAAKARAGSEIINLTYRDKYVEDPGGQWQGYKDTDEGRAWGLDGWGRRAGMGAYFDWLTANAILPAQDPDDTREGIEKVDRVTVSELSQIASAFGVVQAQVDKADAGLNPVGLAKGVVPFDIDPNFNEVGSGNQGETHFEQIANRAQQALDNALTVFDHASQQSQALRRVQDDAEALTRTVTEQEQDFKNRLIEIFGYPYAGDPEYPSGYDGPDLYHFEYVSSDIARDGGGPLPTPDEGFTGYFSPMQLGSEPASHFFTGDVLQDAIGAGSYIGECVEWKEDQKVCLKSRVAYPVASSVDWGFIAPESWGKRRAPGEIQIAISDLLLANNALNRAIIEHENLLADVEAAAVLLDQEFELATKTISILSEQRDDIVELNIAIGIARAAEVIAMRIGQSVRDTVEALDRSIPDTVGLSNDVFAPLKGIANTMGVIAAANFEIAGDVAGLTGSSLELAKERVALQTEVRLATETPFLDAIQRVKDLEQLWRQEAVFRLEMMEQGEIVLQTAGRLQQLFAEGDRLLEERRLFRVFAAGDIQEYRYRDMTFRIFRNDALQKFRAQFDLAARYIYLAATAYDYETNLLSDANGSGRELMTSIVKQRTLGQVLDGVPVAGTPGLADVLARLQQNYAVYKGQLGFNNPQFEDNRFSLRRGHFRRFIENGEGWKQELDSHFVADLRQDADFKRFARPFAPDSLGAQPALVIPFDTTVTFGMNYFGHALGGGDSAYDPTNFATKIRSVGIWFSDYDNVALSNTPRVYLIPVGMDIMRSPESGNFETREWRIVDQKLPVPFPIGASDLNDINWIPKNDSLSDTFADVRRFSSFRAYPDNEGDDFDPAETSADSRLIGRSVWNSQWKLIIPAGTLLNTAGKGEAFNREGIDRLIYGKLVDGAQDNDADTTTCLDPLLCRDGNGISDIKLHFSTYGYSGN